MEKKSLLLVTCLTLTGCGGDYDTSMENSPELSRQANVDAPGLKTYDFYSFNSNSWVMGRSSAVVDESRVSGRVYNFGDYQSDGDIEGRWLSDCVTYIEAHADVESVKSIYTILNFSHGLVDYQQIISLNNPRCETVDEVLSTSGAYTLGDIESYYLMGFTDFSGDARYISVENVTSAPQISADEYTGYYLFSENGEKMLRLASFKLGDINLGFTQQK